MFTFLCYLLAFVLFALAALGVSGWSRINFVAAGLAFMVLPLLSNAWPS